MQLQGLPSTSNCLAEQGAEVIGIDLDETGLKQTAALVDPDSAKSFTYFVGDVSSPSFVQATMKQIVKTTAKLIFY